MIRESSKEVRVCLGDALDFYQKWPSPHVIISDGAYGVRGFPGDPPTAAGLPAWYEPHVQAWSRYATGQTTLWFWNTELGWATIHPLLVKHGWEYRSCHIWDKGKGHVAGNANTKTLRKFPIVTEVCVQYVRVVKLTSAGQTLPLKDWLRAEWQRTGLPLNLTNEACGVLDAATRKYFTKDHLWYFPPPEHFEGLVNYANRHGAKEGKPYFSANGRRPLTKHEWSRMRAKFYCTFGVNNVWQEPPVRGIERLKDAEKKVVHANQKPLRLIDRIIQASSDAGDVVWEPFGGLCSAAVVSASLDRSCYSAELLPDFFKLARERVKEAARGERKEADRTECAAASAGA